MEKIRIKNYTEVFVADYPFHKELREEIVPILEQYPDKQDMKTNVKATHTEWDWYSDNPRIKRLKECMLAQAGSWCEYSYIGERNTALYLLIFGEMFIGRGTILKNIIIYLPNILLYIF